MKGKKEREGGGGAFRLPKMISHLLKKRRISIAISCYNSCQKFRGCPAEISRK